MEFDQSKDNCEISHVMAVPGLIFFEGRLGLGRGPTSCELPRGDDEVLSSRVDPIISDYLIQLLDAFTDALI